MRFLLTICLVMEVLFMGVCADAKTDRPVKLIFDTDIGNDIDDAMALAMIHTLADRGEAELLAVTVNKDNPWAGVYVDIVNHFYGRPDTPIGTVRNGKTPEDGYIGVVSQRKVDGKFVYPRRLKSGADAPEAVGLLRKTLAAQPDGSVVIVSVGFMTNLARLLDSKPDSVSSLSGMDLVKQKVRLYVMMAGAYEATPGPEYNIIVDVEASKEVLAHWPTPLVATGYEVGREIRYPAESIEKDFSYVANHPIAEAYRIYQKMPYDRETWDLTAVLYAVRPDRGYFGLSSPGKMSVDDKKVTQFTAGDGGSHRFMTVTPEQIVRIREAFTWLVPAPPRGCK